MIGCKVATGDTDFRDAIVLKSMIVFVSKALVTNKEISLVKVVFIYV